VQSHEVESRFPCHDAAVVQRLAVLSEDREINPLEPGQKTGRPDHVLDFQDPSILELGQTALHPDDSWYSLDARRDEILRFDSDQRGRPQQHPGPHLSPDRRVHVKDVVAECPDEVNEKEASGESVNPERHDPWFFPREPGRMPLSHFHRDFRSGVAGTHDQHSAGSQLRRVPIVARVELHDPKVELGREPRDSRPAIIPCRDHDLIRLEALFSRLHQKMIVLP
jgi:hypothetical protein